ncbi:MAG: uroporphyrinogen-III synthase [Paraperlucidibaca sp.]
MRVLNPRPARQAQPLSQALREAGHEVVELPLLAIEPLALDAVARAQVLALDRYDGIVFVSANAARYAVATISDYWPQWPHPMPCVAVGQATAAVLEAEGLRVHIAAQEDSEGMLALPILHDVAGQRWLVCRGEDGRELLATTLRERGAEVDTLALYKRFLPDGARTDWASCYPRPEVVLLSSAMIWQHWQQIAGSEATTPWLITVSQRLAEAVRAAGATRVICADGAQPMHWLKALTPLL